MGHRDDGLCYVKDSARAIALLQLVPRLSHRTCNIASGRVVTNGKAAAALTVLVRGARLELPRRQGAGRRGPGGLARYRAAPRGHRVPARL